MSARAHFGKYVPCSRRMYCANSCFSRSVRSTVSGDEGAAISRGVMSEMPLPVIGTVWRTTLPVLLSSYSTVHERPNCLTLLPSQCYA